MTTVTVSPKFQVVIPKEIRERLGLQAGQKLEAILLDGCIELVPRRELADMKGFLRGIDRRVEREDDRV